MADFWEGKRVVTAGNGFIGTAVHERIADMGAVAILSSGYDYRDASVVKSLIEKSNPDIIINAAGVTGNKDQPAKLFYDNLMIGANLLHEACMFNPNIKFVNLGTARSYAPPYKKDSPPVKEEDFWKGYPAKSAVNYAMAKSILLVQSQSYRKQYNFDSIYLILANVYGPGDNFSENSPVIPSMIKKIHEHKQGLLYMGTKSTRREFIYIDNVVDAILLSAEKYSEEAPLNIGTGWRTSIFELQEIISDCLNHEHSAITWGYEYEKDSPVMDISRAEEKIGFLAKVPIGEGIRKTVKWYLENK